MILRISLICENFKYPTSIDGDLVQIAKKVNMTPEYVAFDQLMSEKKLMSRKYTSNILTITLGMVGVLWLVIGALRLMNIIVFFPPTIVSWILYFSVAVIIGIGVQRGMKYANDQLTTRHFFYEKVREGSIVGHTFMDEGRYTHLVHVIFVGKNYVGQDRHDIATISFDKWREGGYAIGKKISIE